MERDDAPSRQDRTESLVFFTLKTVLAVVLVAALAAGGRDVMTASSRATNITAAP